MQTLRKLPITAPNAAARRAARLGRRADHARGRAALPAPRAAATAATAATGGRGRRRELVRRTGGIERHAADDARANECGPVRRPAAAARVVVHDAPAGRRSRRAPAAARAAAPPTGAASRRRPTARIASHIAPRRSPVAPLRQRRRRQRPQPPGRAGRVGRPCSNQRAAARKSWTKPVVHEPDVLHVFPFIGSLRANPFCSSGSPGPAGRRPADRVPPGTRRRSGTRC